MSQRTNPCAHKGYTATNGNYILSLHERIAKYVIIDGESRPRTPLPSGPCWFWDAPRSPMSRTHRSGNSFPLPCLRYNGRKQAPYRHFFPDLPHTHHLTMLTCPDLNTRGRGTMCVNPHHRLPPADQVFDPDTGFWHAFDRVAFLKSCLHRLTSGEIKSFDELVPQNALEKEALDALRD
jgi:hypothetical protein